MNRKRNYQAAVANRTIFASNTKTAQLKPSGTLLETLEQPSFVTTLPTSIQFDLPLKLTYPAITPAPPAPKYAARPTQILGQTLPVLIITLAGASAWLFGPVNYQNFWNIFLGLVIEILPFLLLGAGLAALIAPDGFRKHHIWDMATRSRARAVVTSLGMSLTLPVCECGTALIARRTNKAGAPVLLTIVFLLAAPIINPVTLLVTYLAFEGNGVIILGRAGLGVVIALAVGIILSLYPRPTDLFVPEATALRTGEHDHDLNHDHSAEYSPDALPGQPSKFTGFNQFVNRMTVEAIEAIRIVLPGIALAALFQSCIPLGYFMDLGQGPFFSVIGLMLLAALMSICSSADAFVALSFATLFPTGSILAFLVFGPLINLKSIFLFRLVLSWRSIGLITGLCFSLVLVAGSFLNLWLA